MSVGMKATTVSGTGVADIKFVSAPTGKSDSLLSTKVVAPMCIPEADQKNESEQLDEMLTTDVGSCSSSDTESCSSVADHEDKLARSKQGVGPLGFRRRSSKRSSGVFGGTPLEPIPGTPVASEQTHPKFLLSTAAPSKRQITSPAPLSADSDSAQTDTDGSFTDVPAMPPPRSPKRRTRPSALTIAASGPVVNAVALGPFGTAPASQPPGSPKKRARAAASDDGVTSVRLGVFGTTPAPQAPPKRRSKASDVEPTAAEAANGFPLTPKKQARDATMAKAKRNGVPLKVKLPEQMAPTAIHGFDHMTPMKKRPVFADVAGPEPANALLRLEPGMPVKKRVPCFLLEEPFRGIQPPPGLERMPRQKET